MFLVGPPGIEPGLYAPEAYVLPVYYGPTKNITHERMYNTSVCTFQDSNLRPFECESNALTN